MTISTKYLTITCALLTVFSLFLGQNTGKAAGDNTTIHDMLAQNYEKNAEILKNLIMSDQFEDVERFLDYVVANDLVTRDGIRYFRAVLGYWFYAPERPHPFPVEILSHLDNWVKKHSDSAFAYIVRGTFYLDYAWEARGRGWAKDVDEKAGELYRERLVLAQQDLIKASKRDPQNPHSLRQLMRIALENTGGQDTEEVLFQQVIARAPSFYWAYRAKLNGLMPKWGGSWSAMFRFAQETEKQAPPKTLLPLILVHAHEEAAARSKNTKGYYAAPLVWHDIERIYTQVIADFPQSGRWKTEFGDIAYVAGKMDLAKQYWMAAAESDAYDLKTSYAIAWLYEEEGQWELQEKYARRLVELYPRYAKGYGVLGYAAGQQEKYQEAVESYTSAIELAPQEPLYWNNRCYYYNWLGEFEKAISDCTKAIELKEDYAAAYGQRKYAYEQLGKTHEAEVDRKMYEKLAQ